jgi:hypothetical protein
VDIVSAVRAVLKAGAEIGVQAGEAAAIAAYPWLGLPFIKQIWETILEHYAAAFDKALMDESTKLIIPIIDKIKADAAEAESAKYKAMLEGANATSEQLQKENDEWEQKYADLIHQRRATPD